MKANPLDSEIGIVDTEVDRRRICYLVSHGFAARMVLHSDLTKKLISIGFDVIILVPKGVDSTLSSYCSRHLKIRSIEHKKNAVHSLIGDARRYLREPIRRNAALWSRHQFLVNGGAGTFAGLYARFNYLLHKCFYRSKLFRSVFDYIDICVHRGANVRQLIKDLGPSLLVSTYPVTAIEITALLEAKALGIPTVGHLLSWDNITCKGRFTAVPDWFVAWGPVMTAELEECYDISPQKIYECGVPHFDAHRDLVNAKVNKKTLDELGLDPKKPYLFFGMSAPIFAPHEIDVVEWLAEQVRSNRFGPDMQLVVRPHPQNVRGNMADISWLPRLQALHGNRVALNLPILRERGFDWDMDASDLAILVNLLEGCSICLNSGSTLSIDALAHNKPVVVTLFDGAESLPWWKSAKRIADYPHYKKLISFGGISPVGSFSELATEIDGYLENSRLRVELRIKTLREQCGLIDGESSGRVADAILRIAECQPNTVS